MLIQSPRVALVTTVTASGWMLPPMLISKEATKDESLKNSEFTQIVVIILAIKHGDE